MRVHIHSYAGMILCGTCYKRPPVLSDHFCCAEEAVAIDRFYCTTAYVSYVLLCISHHSVSFEHVLLRPVAVYTIDRLFQHLHGCWD